MKYALVEKSRSIAKRDLKGICQSCGSEMIPKCGNQKVNHWAHKSRRNCDPWYERETKWHRDWKNIFDEDWQEFIFKDSDTNEKHVADVYTENGLIVEFQHSYINGDEKKSREAFYKNMVWIVDGTRLENDFKRFKKSFIQFLEGPKSIRDSEKLFEEAYLPDMFPKSWLESDVPVIFDFKTDQSKLIDGQLRNKLYCLFPQEKNRHAGFESYSLSGWVAVMSRKVFIQAIKDGSWTERVNNFLARIKSERDAQRKRMEPKIVMTRRGYAFLRRQGL